MYLTNRRSLWDGSVPEKNLNNRENSRKRMTIGLRTLSHYIFLLRFIFLHSRFAYSAICVFLQKLFQPSQLIVINRLLVISTQSNLFLIHLDPHKISLSRQFSLTQFIQQFIVLRIFIYLHSKLQMRTMNEFFKFSISY